jgi:hypothetical protein
MKPNNATGLVFVFGTVLLTVAGQLLVKRGMSQMGPLPAETRELARFFWNVLTHPCNFFGLACAFLAALSWMAALTKCDLSFAYPFTGLALVLTLVLSSALFGERVQPGQWLGVLLVCLGLWVSSRFAK